MEAESNKKGRRKKVSVAAEGAEPVGDASKKRKRAQGEVEEEIEEPPKKGRGRPVTLKRKADTDGERGDKTKKARLAAAPPPDRLEGLLPKSRRPNPSWEGRWGSGGIQWCVCNWNWELQELTNDFRAPSYRKAFHGRMIMMRSRELVRSHDAWRILWTDRGPQCDKLPEGYCWNDGY